MQIVVPMAGFGQRFIQAGYEDHKALIEVEGKPIIEHVLSLFPGESNILLICNQHQLKDKTFSEAVNKLSRHIRVTAIEPHRLGPVFTLLEASKDISLNEEVIVNYCDFSVDWDYADFLKRVRASGAEGAMSAYRGFHPHMLGSNYYAFIREKNQYLLEIKEKQPFTDEPMNEYASTGTYYFRKGQDLIQYCRALYQAKNSTNGEYYLSMVYNLMVAECKPVLIYEVQHMLQWGTPEDLEEYLGWSAHFLQHRLAKPQQTSPVIDNLVMLMAGRGQRFSQVGYTLPKPQIDVDGLPMFHRALDALPPAKETYFALLAFHQTLNHYIKAHFPKTHTHLIEAVTSGQATTAFELIQGLPSDESVLLGACDCAFKWDADILKQRVQEADALIFACKNHAHALRHPKQYSWLECEGDDVIKVSVKQPVSQDVKHDFTVAGIFYFKRASLFIKAYQSMLKQEMTIGQEYYVDSMMNILITCGAKVKVMPIDDFVCWGTPDDLATYRYWARYFKRLTVTNQPSTTVA